MQHPWSVKLGIWDGTGWDDDDDVWMDDAGRTDVNEWNEMKEWNEWMNEWKKSFISSPDMQVQTWQVPNRIKKWWLHCLTPKWRLKYLIRWIKIKNLMYKKTLNQDSMCDKELKKIENFWLNVQTLFEEIYSGSMTFWTDMGRKTVLLLPNSPFYCHFLRCFLHQFLIWLQNLSVLSHSKHTVLLHWNWTRVHVFCCHFKPLEFVLSKEVCNSFLTQGA